MHSLWELGDDIARFYVRPQIYRGIQAGMVDLGVHGARVHQLTLGLAWPSFMLDRWKERGVRVNYSYFVEVNKWYTLEGVDSCK